MAKMNLGSIAKDAAKAPAKTKQPSKQAPKRGRGRPPKDSGQPTWEDRYTRRTLYVSNDVMAAIEAEMRETKQTKSHTLNAALAAYYKIDLDG